MRGVQVCNLGVEEGFLVSLQLGLSNSTEATKPIVTRSSLSSTSASNLAMDKVKKHIKKEVKETRTTIGHMAEAHDALGSR